MYWYRTRLATPTLTNTRLVRTPFRFRVALFPLTVGFVLVARADLKAACRPRRDLP